MYILVHHEVHDAERFWAAAEKAIPQIPEGVQLHQTIPAKDGTRATCLWEADSVERVKEILEPAVGDVATNRYAEAENREGMAMPSKVNSE
ncbi:MAG: hypothetical protein R3300_20475 [Candidatus Promineifilaceae bacterium]|nr:hypothetical protein [Candidatus Promineifilaceae bacterium]